MPTKSIDLWEPVAAPPGRRAPKRLGHQVAERLRTERPGEWVRIRRSSHTNASFARGLRKQGCETSVSRMDDGSYELYARWAPGTPTVSDAQADAVLSLVGRGDGTAPTRTERAAKKASAPVERPKPITVTVPAPVATTSEVARDLSAGTERMQSLRAAMRDWPVARRAGFRPTDLIERIPDDVLDGAARPATLVDLAMDAGLHGRVVAWLKEESAA